MRHLMLRTALALGIGLGGCATLPSLTEERLAGQPCLQEDAETFLVRGHIDAAMTECVTAALLPTTRTLILDTPGGDVASALTIAERFEGRGLVMRIVGECNSSCANYFLPLARRIEVEPGSVVLLHGSIDAQFIDLMVRDRDAFLRERATRGRSPEEAETDYTRFLDSTAALAAREEAFARRNGVAPGWLLRRRQGSSAIEGTEGAPRGDATAALIVEEDMMRSCLTAVDVQPYRLPLAGTPVVPFRDLWWLWRGLARSGGLRCAPAT
jgi:hypothetical protein